MEGWTSIIASHEQLRHALLQLMRSGADLDVVGRIAALLASLDDKATFELAAQAHFIPFSCKAASAPVSCQNEMNTLRRE